jgi:hypothetical protein
MKRSIFLSLFGLVALSSSVQASPASGCARKFVGSWTVRVNATGQTYPSQILPNGRTQVVCPMCTPGGTWTCEGNTITVQVDNGVVTQHQLQADGRTMVGGCCTITRMGAVPANASVESVPQEQGLKEGPTFGRLPVRAKREAYDIAREMLTTALGQWLDRTNENLDLKEKIRNSLARIDEEAKDGRWINVQRDYAALQPFLAEARKRGLKLSSRFDVLVR